MNFARTRIIQIPRHWDADEAQTAVAFLDQLKEALVDNCADQTQQAMAACQDDRDRQIDFIEDVELVAVCNQLSLTPSIHHRFTQQCGASGK